MRRSEYFNLRVLVREQCCYPGKAYTSRFHGSALSKARLDPRAEAAGFHRGLHIACACTGRTLLSALPGSGCVLNAPRSR